MKAFRSFYLLLLLLAPGFSFSQTPLWDYAAEPYYHSSFQQLVPGPTGSFVAGGIALKFSLASWPMAYPYIAKFSASGNRDWLYFPNSPIHESGELTALLPTSDGGFLAGYYGNGCDYFEGVGSVHKLDAAGNLQWTHFYYPSLGPFMYYWRGAVELSSGNVMLASTRLGGMTDYGFLKISSSGDSLGFYQFNGVGGVSDLEVIASDEWLLTGDSQVVRMDTLGTLLYQLSLPDVTVEADYLPGGNIVILTPSALYLADAQLQLLDSVLFSGMILFPLSVHADGTDFWVAWPDQVQKFDASLALTNTLNTSGQNFLTPAAVELSADAICFAGFSGVLLSPGLGTHAPPNASVRTMDRNGNRPSAPDIGVSSVNLNNAAYNSATGEYTANVSVTVRNFGTVAVDSFQLKTPFGIGFGWFCGGPFSSLRIADPLAPGDSLQLNFNWWDAEVIPSQVSNYTLCVYTMAPNRHMDADSSNDVTCGQANSVDMDPSGPGLLISQLYPNPAQDQVKIEWFFAGENAQADIYNTAGQKIYSTVIAAPGGLVPVGDLTPGLYLVKITSGEKQSVHRLVKL